jgi:hypothetical protein
MMCRAAIALSVLCWTNLGALARPHKRDVIEHCSKDVQKMKLNSDLSGHDMLKACEANGGIIPGKASGLG